MDECLASAWLIGLTAITAAALAASVVDPHAFRSGREFVSIRLVGALMLEQNDEGAVSRRYMPVEKLTGACDDADDDRRSVNERHQL